MKAAPWSLVAMGFAVVVACKTQSPPPLLLAGHPECPHTWADSDSVPSGDGWQTVNVPEFNDCQRFILVPDPHHRAYTKGYFAIFAKPDTMPLRRRMHPIFGSNVTTGVPVAFVYAESEGDDGLRITPGGNCLYLYLNNKSWAAFMAPAVHPTGHSVTCQEDLRPERGKELLVHREQVTGMGPGDYPNVARWDWDTAGHHQYAGVRCDGAWCDVGPTAGFTPSSTHAEWSVGSTAMEHRPALVKGWYDEQYLARCDAPGGACHPTALVGTIIPVGAIDTMQSMPDSFVPVARIGIRVDPTVPEAAQAKADLDTYQKKFAYQETPARALNTLLYCHGSAVACHVPDEDRSCPAATPDETEHLSWWYKIIPAGVGAPKFGCMTRRQAADGAGHVVGAARWRWLLRDETSWTRCVQGCCEVHGT